MAMVSERSAGGILVRRRDGDGRAEICLIRARGSGRWAIPKGHLEPGETDEQAAVREVREETGCLGTLRVPLGEVDYTYRRRRRHIAKRVAFFWLDYVEGSTADHDGEVLEARWIPIEKAARRLIYPAERSIVERAAQMEAAGTLRTCSP